MKTVKVKFTSGGNRPDIGEFKRGEEMIVPEPVAVELIGCGLAEHTPDVPLSPTVKDKKPATGKGVETEAKTNG